jgi:transcriptional regulator GlxA family with amidase domain
MDLADVARMPNNPRFSPNRLQRIELLAFSHVQMLDVTGPLQVFATANEIVGGAGPAYDIHVVSQAGGAVASSSGVGLMTEPLPLSATGADTLIVAGGPGVEAAAADPVLVDWVRGRACGARRFASVCTGAELLATSGLLDGRRAATHWSFCAELARRFPAVRVEPDPIFVHDGPAWTSAGVTAGIDLALALVEEDLALALVEEDLGRIVALAVARYLVVFLKRPGGQAQISATLNLQGAERFEALHGWIATHLAHDLSLPVLARQAGMSERSFSRHYAGATGLSAPRAVEQLRVEAARILLVDTPVAVKRVAQRCGFGSEETMRRSFLRLLAVTPQRIPRPLRLSSLGVHGSRQLIVRFCTNRVVTPATSGPRATRKGARSRKCRRPLALRLLTHHHMARRRSSA